MDIYAHRILDHYKHPRHYGELPDADASAERLNPTCGDSIKVFVKLNGDQLSALHFTGSGCAISQSTASLLTDQLLGKTAAEILAMNLDSIRELLKIDISDRRANCALLALQAIQEALLKLKNS